jgi:hypothetical protein
MKRTPSIWTLALALSACFGLASCAETASTEPIDSASGRISPQMMADALHAVMESDRTVYTRNVVNRLQNEEGVILASEHWQDDKALPLPAQMFRMGAEMVAGKTDVFSYSLLSLWPVNKQNAPRTEAETAGLEAISAAPEPYYTEETLGGRTYFTAIYPDVAVAQACISCHNDHADSPRSDFELGETMGGVVIRIPLDM